jgi:hypothetical protein
MKNKIFALGLGLLIFSLYLIFAADRHEVSPLTAGLVFFNAQIILLLGWSIREEMIKFREEGIVLTLIGEWFMWRCYGVPTEMGEVGYAMGIITLILGVLWIACDYYANQDDPVEET